MNFHLQEIESLQNSLREREKYVTELENRLRALWDKLEGERKHYMDRIKRLEEALTSIGEYWNRDNNERAMEDACWHAVNTAADALQAKEDKL